MEKLILDTGNMRYLKTYENFSEINILEGIDSNDISNFTMIFNSLYESHLTINEKILIDSNYGMINESWFSDLVDKGKRGVLVVKSKAGELLVDLAKKAKDVLDFAKSLAGQIGNYVKTQFLSMEQKIKDHALAELSKDGDEPKEGEENSSEFVKIIVDFIQKKKLNKLTSYIRSSIELVKYIAGGQIITDLITRLSEVFSSVLNLGTNEGLNYLESDFLLENNDEEEKKSFLQRLGERLMTYPPFSWIPKIEDLMKKGINIISQLIDKFFGWLTTGKSESISKFSKSITFIFQILELYAFYKILGGVIQFKKYVDKATGLEDITKSIKGKAMSEIWNTVGFNGENVVSGIKSAVMKMPYVGSILTILDTLVVGVGVYMTIKPTLDELKIV